MESWMGTINHGGMMVQARKMGSIVRARGRKVIAGFDLMASYGESQQLKDQTSVKNLNDALLIAVANTRALAPHADRYQTPSTSLMNIDKETAGLLIERVLESMDVMSASANIVRERCDSESFGDYQRKVATLVSDIEDALLKPIYSQYPHLRPY
jgi:hypothetical protein